MLIMVTSVWVWYWGEMARLGMQILGIDDPLSFRDLIVYVEMDRCATDDVSVVTGCTLGRR